MPESQINFKDITFVLFVLGRQQMETGIRSLVADINVDDFDLAAVRALASGKQSQRVCLVSSSKAAGDFVLPITLVEREPRLFDDRGRRSSHGWGHR